MSNNWLHKIRSGYIGFGNSHLKFNDKVYFHFDYFGAVEILYEHLPQVGGIVRYVKKRISK